MSGTTAPPVVGTLTVTGVDHLSAPLVVGDVGDGLLNINAGGVVTDSASVTVGTIGGNGTISITSGGTLSTGGASDNLAATAGTSGTVVVDGSGSEWTSAGQIGVGTSGDGTLIVSNSATVSAMDELDVGESAGATGNLLIDSGGQVSSGGSDDTIAGDDPKSSGTVTVTGANSSWNLTAGLLVGGEGSGVLSITDGGTVSITGTGFLSIGVSVGATGSVLVSNGGLLNLSSSADGIGIGRFGNGTLDIEAGGTVAVMDADGVGVGQSLGATGELIVNGSSALFSDNGGLNIGDAGVGTLLAENGGTVQLNGKIGVGVGVDQGGTGMVVVNDALLELGSSTSGLGVGEAGTGTLTVENNSTIQLNGTSGFSVGLSIGGVGLATISHSFINLGSSTSGLGVGEAGTGTLAVENNSTIQLNGTSGFGVGVSIGSVGLATISDSFINLGTATAGLSAGDGGDGTLIVENNSTIQLNNTSGFGIGDSIGAVGQAIVSDSLINLGTATNGVGVGEAGDGTLTIDSNGTVELNGTTGIGIGQSSTNAAGLIVVNQGALIEAGPNTTGMGIGEIGSGTLMIEAGGTVELEGTTTAANIRVGTNTTGTGLITVAGAGALLDLDTPQTGMNIGEAGAGTLQIETGGTVEIEDSSTTGGLGIATASTGTGLITVSGSNALLDLQMPQATGVGVGQAGNGTLEIQSGATMVLNDPVSGGIGVGVTAGSSGTLLVSGSGSLLQATGTIPGTGMTVGNGGAGMFTINDGAVVDLGAGLKLGGASTGSGSVLIDGATLNAGWITDGGGGLGTLMIQDNAQVSLAGLQTTNIGGAATGSGLLVLNSGTVNQTAGTFDVGVTGVGSVDIGAAGLINVPTLAVGESGLVTDTGTLIAQSLIDDGGVDIEGDGTLQLDGTSGIVMGDSIGSTGSLLVDGSHSTLNESASLIIGDSGTGSAQIIDGGSIVITGSSLVRLGLAAGGSGTLLVEGEGASLDFDDEAGMFVGDAGTGLLDIEAGGTVDINSSGGIATGINTDAAGTVIVNGSGALLEFDTETDGFGIGRVGSGTLTIEAGGTVLMQGTNTGGASTLGQSTGSSGLIVVSGAGSLLDFETPQAGPAIGQSGSGTLDVLSGGTVLLDDTVGGGIGVGVSASGNGTLFISGIGSSLTETGTIPGTGMTVGNAGTGTLVVNMGAALNIGAGLKIGGSSSGVGSALIDDAVLNTGWITDGGGGLGTLTITAGSTATVAGRQTTNIGDAATGSGTLVVNDSSLIDTNGTFSVGVAGTGVAEIDAGAFLAAPTISVGSSGFVSEVQGTITATDLMVANNGTIAGSGLLAGTSGIENDGSIEAQAGSGQGTLFLSGPITGTGSLGIGSNATLALSGSVAGGESVFFASNSGTLVLTDPIDFLGTITSFMSGDGIVIQTSSTATFEQSGSALSIVENGISIASIAFASNQLAMEAASSPSDLQDQVLCFLRGSFIATPDGETPVERLSVGDRVLTASGHARPIAWIGKGRVLATRGRRSAATPVIIRKSAFADNVPNRDLHVTKGHAFYFNGALIPVEFLVNHRSILWDDQAQEVELYHIELDSHDVLLANGAAAESYRDDGNRWLFQNANSGWGLLPKEPCAPVLTGGPLVDTIWRGLLDRAGRRPGVVLTDDPDLHLVADGMRLDPISVLPGQSVFRLARPPAALRIASRAASPQELGIARDARQLGVALQRIVIRQKTRQRVIEADDPRLRDGYHDYEPDSQIRWTDGNAAIPVEVFAGGGEAWFLTLQLCGSTQYREDAPKRRVA